MRFTTFYFSGTGNTKWAAQQFEAAAKENGDESRAISIEETALDLISILRDSDMLGIAFPVYAMNVPPIMKRFIARINADLIALGGPPKPLYVLITAGYADGCGPREAARAFSPGTVRLTGYAGLRIATNIYTPPRSGAPIDPKTLEQRLDAARKKIAALAGALGAGKKKVPLGPYTVVMFRDKMNNVNLEAYKNLKINPDTCDECHICMKNCPTGAIKIKDGAMKMTPACTACFRCYNNCPTASIWYKGEYADPSVYPRYAGPMAPARTL